MSEAETIVFLRLKIPTQYSLTLCAPHILFWARKILEYWRTQRTRRGEECSQETNPEMAIKKLRNTLLGFSNCQKKDRKHWKIGDWSAKHEQFADFVPRCATKIILIGIRVIAKSAVWTWKPLFYIVEHLVSGINKII
jgi:hypothetical protein